MDVVGIRNPNWITYYWSIKHVDVEGMVSRAFIGKSLMAELQLGSVCNCYQEYEKLHFSKYF